jgi:hypothetical protein
MLEVLEEEWQAARVSAEAADGFGGRRSPVFDMKRGPYSLERFRRAVRAYELRRSDPRQSSDGQTSRLTQDLGDLMQFSKGCVVKTEVVKGILWPKSSKASCTFAERQGSSSSVTGRRLRLCCTRRVHIWA